MDSKRKEMAREGTEEEIRDKKKQKSSAIEPKLEGVLENLSNEMVYRILECAVEDGRGKQTLRAFVRAFYVQGDDIRRLPNCADEVYKRKSKRCEETVESIRIWAEAKEDFDELDEQQMFDHWRRVIWEAISLEKREVLMKLNNVMSSLNDAIRNEDSRVNKKKRDVLKKQVMEFMWEPIAEALGHLVHKTSDQIWEAFRVESTDLRALLLEQGTLNAENEFGMKLLLFVIKTGDISMAKLLIEHGADIGGMDSDHRDAVQWAIICENKGMLEMLMQYKPDLNKKNASDSTPLGIAVSKGNIDMVELLLENRADIGVREGIEQNTPLHEAAMNKCVGMRPRKGLIALHGTPRHDSMEVIQVLLRNRADLNARNAKGETALHLAAINCDYDMIKVLLEAKADVNVKDNKRRTALDYAKRDSHNNDVIKLFEIVETRNKE